MRLLATEDFFTESLYQNICQTLIVIHCILQARLLDRVHLITHNSEHVVFLLIAFVFPPIEPCWINVQNVSTRDIV